MDVPKIYRSSIRKDSLTARDDICEFWSNSLSEFDQNYISIFSSKAFFITGCYSIFINFKYVCKKPCQVKTIDLMTVRLRRTKYEYKS